MVSSAQISSLGSILVRSSLNPAHAGFSVRPCRSSVGYTIFATYFGVPCRTRETGRCLSPRGSVHPSRRRGPPGPSPSRAELGVASGACAPRSAIPPPCASAAARAHPPRRGGRLRALPRHARQRRPDREAAAAPTALRGRSHDGRGAARAVRAAARRARRRDDAVTTRKRARRARFASPPQATLESPRAAAGAGSRTPVRGRGGEPERADPHHQRLVPLPPWCRVAARPSERGRTSEWANRSARSSGRAPTTSSEVIPWLRYGITCGPCSRARSTRLSGAVCGVVGKSVTPGMNFVVSQVRLHCLAEDSRRGERVGTQ